MASVRALSLAAATGILLVLSAVSVTPSGGAHSPARRPAACDAESHGGLIVLACVRAQGAYSLTGDCCQVLHEAADKRGLWCLCQAAATPDVLTSGYTVAEVLSWYSDCGGGRPVNLSNLESTCSDDRVVASGNDMILLPRASTSS